MKIFVMRHGQTAWNSIGKIQGWSANRLSKLGKEQAQTSSKEFKDKKIDLIFSSPLMRTMQTANIMNIPHKVKIIKDERLIEKNKGIFVGRFKKTLTEQEKILRTQYPERCGMETFKEIYDRTYSFLDYLKHNFKDKNILIVTHMYIANMIENILTNKNITQDNILETSHFKNGEIRMFEI